MSWNPDRTLITPHHRFNTHIPADEEYRRIIAGADGEESVDKDSEAKNEFLLADIDKSGSISLSEYLAMSRDKAMSAKEATGLSATEGMASRFTALEKRVEENSRKLDKIYKLLEEMKQNM